MHIAHSPRERQSEIIPKFKQNCKKKICICNYSNNSRRRRRQRSRVEWVSKLFKSLPHSVAHPTMWRARGGGASAILAIQPTTRDAWLNTIHSTLHHARSVLLCAHFGLSRQSRRLSFADLQVRFACGASSAQPPYSLVLEPRDSIVKMRIFVTKKKKAHSVPGVRKMVGMELARHLHRNAGDEMFETHFWNMILHCVKVCNVLD